MKPQIKIEEEERVWGEPACAALLFSEKGEIFAVVRLYATCDSILECFETEAEFGCETLKNVQKSFEAVAENVKEWIEWYIENVPSTDTITISVNNSILREIIEEQLQELRNSRR